MPHRQGGGRWGAAGLVGAMKGEMNDGVVTGDVLQVC